MLGDVGGEHPARADPMPEHHRRRAEARPDIGHGHAGLQLQHVDEPGHIELGLPALLRDLRGIRLLCSCGADRAEHDEHLEHVLTSLHGE